MRADEFLELDEQPEVSRQTLSADAFLDAESFLDAGEPSDARQPEQAPDYNMLRGAVERGGQLLGGMFTAGNAAAEAGNESYPLGGLVWEDGLIPDYKGPEEYNRWRAEGGGQEPLKSAAERWTNFDAGYVPNHTWEKLKQEFSEGGPLSGSAWGEVLAYGAEQGIKSTADMAAALVALPSYIMARSGEIGEERARNKGKDEAELVDIAEAAPFALGSAILERIGAKGIVNAGAEEIGKEALKRGLGRIAKEGLKAGGREAATELVQEGVIEYVGEKFGTDAEMSFMEALDRGAAGAVAGGVYGTSAATTSATGREAISAAGQARAGRDKAEAPQQEQPEQESEAQAEATPAQDWTDAVLAEEFLDEQEPVAESATVTTPEDQQQTNDDGSPIADPEQEQVPSFEPVDALTERGTGVFRVPVDQIKVDPEQYQFRSRVNDQGVDKRLEGVKRWDDKRAGSVLLHRREDGSLYVADGHHRVDLARRLNQGEINARVVSEADGISVADARVEAAMNNIADGKAEPIDVAKVFRDSEVPTTEVRDTFNLPGNQAVRDGEALSRLSDNVFGMVTAGQVSEKDGAAIGTAFTEQSQQEAAADAFQKIEPQTDYQRQLLVNEIRASEFAQAQGDQGGLFGDDAQEISLMQDRLKVLDTLRQRLNTDRKLFKSLNDNADRASEAGNQIAAEANESITQQSARSLDLIGRVTTTPALNEMVNRAARRVYDGESRASVVKDLKQELLNYEQGTNEQDSGRPGPAPGRRENAEPGQEPRASEPVPAEDTAEADQSGEPEGGQQEEVAPELELEAQTEEQLAEQARARDEAEQAETEQRRTEEQRTQADEQAGSFALTGSDRTADVAMAAGQEDLLSQAAAETDTSPTDGQKEAGNYKKGKVRIQGLEIAIENPKGSTRSGTDPDGNRWESTMAHHYGDIKGTTAADGDNLDVFIGPDPDIDQVFVIDQPNADGSFDEHKVMLGFKNEKAAKEGYLANYEQGWTVGPITRMTTDEFKAWMQDGDTMKPVAEKGAGQQPEAASINLDQPAHEAFTEMSKAFSGGKALSVDQVKAVFERIVADPAQTKADLNKLTKKDLVRYQAGFPRTDVKKAQMVEFAYDGLISRFRFIGNKSSMISTSLGADIVQIARDHLDTLTDKDVADHAKAQKAAIDERIAEIKQRKESRDNPKTLDDFKDVIRSRGIGALTPEQRATYDRMVAEESMASRDSVSGEREGLQTGERVELGELTEGTHGKTGETIFNVKVISRLGKDAFKEAAGFARSMGGGYYRGNFYFKSREDAEMFSAWVNGETVDTSAKQEQKKAEKREKTTERMKAIADRLQEQADSKTNADRKENTARRMKMADSARADAEQDSRIAGIMKQVAESDSPILKGMTQKVQVELMDSLVRGLKYNAPRDMTYTNNNGSVEFNPEVTPEQRVAYAQIPLKQMYASTIRDLANDMTNTKGFVMHGRRLNSAIKGEPSNKLVMLDDSMVKTVLRYIDQHADKYSVTRDIAAKYKRLERMGITNKPTLRAALLEFMQMDSQPRSAPNKLQQLERDLQRTMVGNRNAFNDFFPTPVETAAEIVDMANISEGMKVLEPSAGNGYLADAAREAGGTVEVVELGGQLREILEEKGHTLVGDDFLDMEAAETYDRIVMNPPFSNDADAKHVAHAYKMLKPGGRLVAITSSMAGDRANKTNQKFRDFLTEVDAEEQSLPDGAFKSSMNPTGVSTKIIVIDKPESDAPAAPMFSRAAPSALQGMTREEFLGNPTITSDRNAAELKPKDLNNDGAPREPFLDGQYQVVLGPDSGAVYDGDKVIASYNFGDKLVVDKKYRRRGIGEELVYRWRTRFPAPAKATERTKKSQALQEKVWDRIQRERSAFRRNSGVQPEAMTAEQARAHANTLMRDWKGRPQVTIADSISEFPKPLRDAIRQAGAESDMRAVFWNDHVYVLAPRIPSTQALEEVILHEVVGHYGLRKMVGGELKPLLNRVYMDMGNTEAAAELKATYYPDGDFDPKNMEHRLTIAEELLAHLAESGNQRHRTLWQRIVTAIRDGLRKLGFTVSMTENDLLKILEGAQRTVEQGGFSRPSESDINFSRKDQASTEAFRNWFGDSKVVDGNGEPMVVYHGTTENFADFSDEYFGEGNGSSDWGDGFYFATSPEAASQYAQGNGGNVMPVYLSIKNPADKSVMLLPEVQDVMDDGMGFVEISEQLESMGYDGIVIDHGKDGREYVAFRPEQIKSAIGNTGAFDPANQDIRFSRGDTAPTKQRQVKFWDGFATQPLDRMFRALFDVTGMVDSHGRLKAGVQITEGAERVLKEWRPNPTGHFTWMDSTLETARHGLIDRYKLTDDYKMAWRQAEAYGRNLDMQAMDILKTLEERGVQGNEAAVLQKILTGETVSDFKMEAVAAPIRHAIDDLGQAAVEYGIITREQFERNRGEYLHRSYLKHEGEFTGLGKFIHSQQRKQNRKIKGDTAKGRGIQIRVKTDKIMQYVPVGWYGVQKKGQKPDLQALASQRFTILENPGVIADASGTLEGVATADQKRTTETVYWPASQPIPAKYDTWRKRGTFEVRGARGDQVTLWRDYTKAEREHMGEILDARYNIAKTFQMLSRDLAMGKFFTDVAQNPEWFQHSQPVDGEVLSASEARTLNALSKADWVEVPDTTVAQSAGTKQWGALSGGFVRAEIWRDLNELDKMHNPGMWRKILTQWKLNKTARSPVVHMNNVISNFVLMDLADVRATDLYKGILSYKTKDEHWRAAQEYGAFEGTFINEEIRRQVLDPILDELTKQNMAADTGAEGTVQTLSRMAYTIWTKVKKFDNAMTDFYQIEDELFRMATYMRRLDLGDEPIDAARTAREQFLDYDIRAPWVNMARRTVLPFISYTYRAVPVVAQSIIHRPWKLAKYFTLAYLANTLAYILAPGDEDEERRTMRDDQQGMTWIGTPRMLRMPWMDEHGNPVFMDIRRWIPAGDVFDMNQGNSALPIPAPIQFGGPLLLGFEFALNKQAFTGEEIVSRDTDTTAEAAGKTADWLYKSWMPSAAYIPESYYWEKFWKASDGARDILGRPYSVPQALLSSIGIKVQPHDVKLGFEFRSRDLASQARIIKADMRRAESDKKRGIITHGEYLKIRARAKRKMLKLKEQADKLSGRD